MNVRILLLIVVVVNSKWNDPWISLNNTNCDLDKIADYQSILTIPEYPITNLDSLLATLSNDYNPDDVNVVCSKGNCDDIISVLEDKIEIRSSNLAIDFEDDQTDKEVVVDFLYNVNSFEDCIPDNSGFPCKVDILQETQLSRIYLILLLSQRLTINIENVNDLRPEFVDFTSGLTLDIFENEDNTTLFRIEAEDTEFPGNNVNLTLELQQPEQNEPFTIIKDNSDDGVWILAVEG